MSTTALQGLLEYLYGTLTPSSMRWVAEHLVEQANKVEEPAKEPELRRYTMAEVNAMLDASEADIAAGRTTPHEEVMRRWKEKAAHRHQERQPMAEAV